MRMKITNDATIRGCAARWLHPLLSAWVSAVIFSSSFVAAAPSLLSEEFATPPMKARPWTFWWFQGGYGNKDGMAKDMAAMREKGIGGVLHMQTNNTTGLPLPSEPQMLGPEWADWFGEAARLAQSAGMTFSASIVDGWAFGGNWVGKEDAAKMLVCSELQVDGSTDMSQALPMPFNRLGVYHDVAVIAFPERPTRALTPASAIGSHTDKGYCDEENWPAIHAADNDPDTFWRTSSAPSAASPVWIQHAYSQPLNAVAVYLKGMPGGGLREGELQVSEDGRNFRPVTKISMEPGEEKQVAIPDTHGRHFRLWITSAHCQDVRLAEFQLLRQGDQPIVRQGIKCWDYKSGNRGIWNYKSKNGGVVISVAMDDVNPFHQQYDLQSSEVIDLSKFLRADGRLDWKAPSGRWTIMRFGWTTIGQHARMSSGGGYEVDVLSTKGADLMFDNAAVGMLKATAKTAPGAMKVFHTDSWEIGADVQGQQPTWTPDFREQFRKRRGYDLLPLLPAMARRIVDDSETTERFLTDYRATIADLIADYYGQLQHRAHQTQTMLNPESGYGSYPTPHLDGLKVFGRADLPMAEISHNDTVENFSSAITSGAIPSSFSTCDVLRTAASGARIYGRQIVQAETLTYHPWLGQVTAPDRYRKTLNYCFANGLNSAVIHKYVHQPFEYKPGLEDYGIFSRHHTWWPMAEGLLGYIGRCQYLLQQVRFVADIAYFVGEGSSRYVTGKAYLDPSLPPGCDYDGMNAEVLLTRLSVREGRWSLPDGLGYRYLVLSQPHSSTMSAEVLEKISQLVKAGGTLIGKPPTRTPGLANRDAADAELKAMANNLWGDGNSPNGIHAVGKGRVVCGFSIEELMQQDNLVPDMVATVVPPDGSPTGSSGPAESVSLDWIHRQTKDTDIYFVANPSNKPLDLQLALRVTGKVPELFDPLTGKAGVLPNYSIQSERTIIPMRFEAYQGLFIVFSQKAPIQATAKAEPNFPDFKPILEIKGPWTVQFDPAWVAPALGTTGDLAKGLVVFDQLADWTQRAEPGLKYYSGIATYSASFNLPDGLAPEVMSKLRLSLGVVKNIARVRLNGKDQGVTWCEPWQADLGTACKPGTNQLEIEVANLWTNRVIGDASLPQDQRLTKSNFQLSAETPLYSSGLLGPVRILAEE